MKSFNKKQVTRFCAVILSILIACPYALAEDVGTVTYVEGRVEVFRQDYDMAVPIRADEPISVGDSIRTKSNAKVEITFKDDSRLRLAQNTKVEIKDYQLDENNNRKAANILLSRGKIRTLIAKMRNPADFVISTPNAMGTITGSDVFAFYKAGNSGMLVTEGRLSVVNPVYPEHEVIVPAGQTVMIPQESMPENVRAYLELEKDMHEQDTFVPEVISREPSDTIMRGAIAKLSGDVKIIKKGDTAPRNATLHDTLVEGDRIQTGTNGMVQIIFDNGNALNLKPNSEILIRTLVIINPETGEYDSTFESRMGKVMARVERLKGNSTFRVKTPAGICGVRGTIMYLEITPSAVKAFFEGGSGYIQDIISKLENTVQAGYNAYADNKSGASTPAATSEQERLEWGSGWDPGSGVEGYSSPEGGVGVVLAGTETGGVAIVGTVDVGAETGEGRPYIPFEESTTPGATQPEPVVEPTTSSGFLYNRIVDSDWDYVDGTFEGPVAFTGNFWNGGSAQFLSAGNFLSDGGAEFAWFSDQDMGNEGYIYSFDEATGAFITSDGGAFFGAMAGIGLDTSGTGASGVLDGFARLLYIDPFGNAGIARGDLAGVYSNTLGAYLIGGTFSGTQIANGIGVAPGDLYNSVWMTQDDGYLYGSFPDGEGEGGYIEGYDTLSTLSIVDYNTGVPQPWGIYTQQLYEGNFYDPVPANWQAVMGGHDAFGAYVYSEEQGEGIFAHYFSDDYGYWIADIINGVWDGNTLSADLDGRFLTWTKTGTMNGQILGTYMNEDGDYGSWQGVGIGDWQGEMLSFSGYWGGDIGSLYLNNDGEFSWVGEDEGLIGATSSPWNGPADFIAMGTYGGGWEDTPESAPIWNTQIISSNVFQENYTTVDGGSFFGYTAGFGNNGVMYGAIVALYIAPTDIEGVYRAGYLMGNVDGVYYPGIQMWMADGTLIPYEMTDNLTGVDPANFPYENIEQGEAIYGGLSGSFDGGGSIRGWSRGYAYYIINDTLDESPWEIFNFRIENDEVDNTYDNSTGTWHGVMGGSDEYSDTAYWLVNLSNGRWSDGTLNANVAGYYLTDETLGIINGSLFGVYSENGTWIGTSIGASEQTPLTFSGYWGEMGPDVYYDYDGDSFSWIDWDRGFIGATESPWCGPEWFLGIGEYDDEYDELYLWNTLLRSYNDQEEDFTTLDGGAFSGYTTGVWTDGLIDGAMVAFYIDPMGRVGYLAADFFGNYYSDISMWTAQGVLIPIIMALDLPIDPAELWDSINDAELSVGLLVNDEYVEPYYDAVTHFLDNQAWGIYNMELGGEKSDLTDVEGERIWGAIITGEGVFGDGSSMGIMEGSVFGATNEAGDWIATSVGVWEDFRSEGSDGDDYGEYYGFFGGVYIDDIMLGRIVALYAQSPELPEIEEGWLDILIGSGGFDNGGNLDFTNFNGSVLSYIDQYWGVWGAYFDGTYSEPSSLFKTMLFGNSYSGGEASDGYWFGVLAGLNHPESDLLSGVFRGIFLGEGGEGADMGLIFGDMLGVLGGDSTWEGVTVGEWHNMGWAGEWIDPSDMDEFISLIEDNTFVGIGQGSFDGGGVIQTTSFDGTDYSILGYPWGIWVANIEGTYSDATNTFRLAVGGSASYTEGTSYLLATILGYTEYDVITGQFKGIWMTMSDDPDKIMAGAITGDIVGYIDVEEEGVGTWQAVGAGEWVEVSELFDPDQLGFDLTELSDFVSVPITEVHSSLMSGAGAFDAGGAISAVMDISFYAISPETLQGIWSALIEGSYSGATGNSWGIDLASPNGDTATLTGTQWEDNQWLANVSGVTSTGENFSGQAGGRYADQDPDGTGYFSGIGAGTWGTE